MHKHMILSPSHLMSAQMAYNAEAQRVAQQAKLQERGVANAQEAAYQARVSAAAQHTPPAHFGRPKVQWFY